MGNGGSWIELVVTKDYLSLQHALIKIKQNETEDFEAKYIQKTMYSLNLELNFIENSDVKAGNFSVALNSFENVIRAKSDHAIAYYSAAKCHRGLGNLEKAKEYEALALKYSKSDFWSKHFTYFNIKIDEK